MSQYRILRNAKNGQVLLRRMEWCDNLWLLFRGLQLRRNMAEDEGLILVYGKESILGSSIHMLFMFFPIAAIWLDKDGRVVDKKLAKTWRPGYASSVPAQYVVEARVSMLDRVKVGDLLRFDEIAKDK